MTTQTTFRNAVLDPTLPVPEDLRDANGKPAGARFSVYRNNVVVSLTEALATGFPLVQKLIGPKTFERLAGVFVRAHPPDSPMMMHYGRAMPAFLERFEPLQHIGYLPDCARLDLALRQSYHAEDAEPFDPACLQGEPEGVMSLHLRTAPATIVLRSRWPLYDLWRFNTEPNAPKPRAAAQDVLITRPEFDPVAWLLPPGAADWYSALEKDLPLAQAIEETTGRTPDFDFAQCLTQALDARALTAPKTKDN